MGDAIGQVLPLGIGIALSPLPIVAVVLMLGAVRARGNGPASFPTWRQTIDSVTPARALATGAVLSGRGQRSDIKW